MLPLGLGDMIMMDFIRAHQLNFMLVLAGVCFALTLCGAISRATRIKKLSLLVMCFSATILMLADRYAYIYRGNETIAGYYMVRICNFLTFLCALLIAQSFNWYLSDFIMTKNGKRQVPMRLRFNEIIAVCGVVVLIVSQFTGLYYTFDEHNRYQRADGYIISAAIPLVMWVIMATVIVQYRAQINKLMLNTLLLFSAVPVIAAIIQIFCYGISITNFAITILAVVLRLIEVVNTDVQLASAHERERKAQKRLFEETAMALANAIDAKDKYTHGHSMRVAEYSREIAKLAGKSEEECEEIYYAGLLHDVGKIGVPETIITKEGKLTDEEYATIRQHTIFGAEILKSITEYPYLSIGAHYHHERYDGRGYPEKLVGNDIPDMARIIAVADSYDAMTSRRSYRKAIPQQKVREEFVSCSGTQFDPQYANIMIHLIDADTQYKMKEKEIGGPSIKDELVVGAHKDNVSIGIMVIPERVTMDMRVRPVDSARVARSSLLLFDSLDGRYYDEEKEIKELLYFEYCELYFDGETVAGGARKIQTTIGESNGEVSSEDYYRVEAARVEDHALIRIIGRRKSYEYIIALPDSSRYTYVGFTGENCIISDMSMKREAVGLRAGDIPRIAEKISFIDVPEGDVPNVQVDRYRSATSQGIPVRDGMSIHFHTRSLPTARLVWHCPFCVIYSSQDGSISGDNYAEYAMVRLDGETWRDGDKADNDLAVTRTGFKGWDYWKALNQKGYEVSISFERNGDTVICRTDNAGILITNTTVVKDKGAEIYVALTGDQVALTNIRINQK